MDRRYGTRETTSVGLRGTSEREVCSGDTRLHSATPGDGRNAPQPGDTRQDERPCVLAVRNTLLEVDDKNAEVQQRSVDNVIAPRGVGAFTSPIFPVCSSSKEFKENGLLGYGVHERTQRRLSGQRFNALLGVIARAFSSCQFIDPEIF